MTACCGRNSCCGCRAGTQRGSVSFWQPFYHGFASVVSMSHFFATHPISTACGWNLGPETRWRKVHHPYDPSFFFQTFRSCCLKVIGSTVKFLHKSAWRTPIWQDGHLNYLMIRTYPRNSLSLPHNTAFRETQTLYQVEKIITAFEKIIWSYLSLKKKSINAILRKHSKCLFHPY